jgi:uncharacterized metal-binding protein
MKCKKCKKCKTCKHWDTLNPRYNSNRAVRRCDKAVQLFDVEEWVVIDGRTKLEIIPEYKDQLMFTQDGSSYAASLYTRAEFFCAHWEKKDE